MVSVYCVFFSSSFLSFFYSDIIQMHVINLICFQRKHKSKMKQKNSEIDVTVPENDDIIHSTPRLKRRKPDDSIVAKYIICNKTYHDKIKKCSVFVGRNKQSCL